MKFKVIVAVSYKKSVLEPQGQASMLLLKDQKNYKVQDIRVGKQIEIIIEDSSEEEAKQEAVDLAEKFLYNPVMETYSITIQSI